MSFEQLFRWWDVCLIKNFDGQPLFKDGEPLRVYVRILGDNDIDIARKHALKISRKNRIEYEKDPSVVIPDLSELDVAQLANLIVLNESTEIYKQVERDVELKYPADKRTPSLAEEELHLEEVDSYYERLQTEVMRQAGIALEARVKEYLNYSHERLLRIAQQSYLNKIVEEDMYRAYNDAVLYFACYEDKDFTVKVFSDMESAGNAATPFKKQLLDFYNTLIIKDTELKK